MRGGRVPAGELPFDPGVADECEHYCVGMMLTCTGRLAQYRDLDDCRAECRLAAADVAHGREASDPIACRLQWLQLVRQARTPRDAATTCRNAGPSGSCGP